MSRRPRSILAAVTAAVATITLLGAGPAAAAKPGPPPKPTHGSVETDNHSNDRPAQHSFKPRR